MSNLRYTSPQNVTQFYGIRAYVVAKDPTMRNGTQRDKTAKEIRDWMKGKVATHKLLRGGK